MAAKRKTGLDRERVRRRKFEQSKLDYKNSKTVEDIEPSKAPAFTKITVPAASAPVGGDVVAPGARQPGQRVSCVWCGTSVTVKTRGPLPKFCSSNCRHRAWEQARAARAGVAAVVVVDRPVVSYPRDVQGWVGHLDRLAQEIRAGRLDAEPLMRALDDLSTAVLGRQARREAVLRKERCRSW